MTTVMGIDAAAGVWLAVVLGGGTYAGADLQPHIADLSKRHPEAEVVAIEIPTGLPVGWVRPADTTVQAFAGPARAASGSAPGRPVSVAGMPRHPRR
jgi:predicted RNase H-like nuclease